MKKRTLALAFACALSLCVLTACGSKEEQHVPETPIAPEASAPVAPEDAPVVQEPETVEPAPGEAVEPMLPFDLSHIDVTLNKEGESFTLTTSQPDAKVYFGSDNEAVVVVDEKGVVTAVAPGTATIIAENEAGQTASCIIRCDWKVASETPAQKPEAPSAGTSVDLKAFYESILASAGENAPFMMDVVMDLGVEGIEMLYPGLSAIAANQQVIYMPAMSAVACEIAMIECANAADVETVKAIFQARIDAQVAGGAWYPETIRGWEENSDIVVNGNYVAMFVIPEGMMDAASEFGKLF